MTDRRDHEPLSPQELHALVHETLCARENLVPELFETAAVPLMTRGRPSGMQFELRALRDVRLTAVWAADMATLYLYDARGTRFAKETVRVALPTSDETLDAA